VLSNKLPLFIGMSSRWSALLLLVVFRSLVSRTGRIHEPLSIGCGLGVV